LRVITPEACFQHDEQPEACFQHDEPPPPLTITTPDAPKLACEPTAV